jgi:transketolase C-terminal domain/subunit
MKTADAIAWPLAADRPTSFRSQLAARLKARLHAFESMPALLTIAGRLRCADPIDARSVAQLTILLSDGSGPCYVRIRRNALTDALQEISQWLVVPQ